MNNANQLFNNPSQYNNVDSQFTQSTNGNPQDLSSAFGSITNLNPSNLDYGQFSNPQLQQPRFSDATSRHQSPSYQSPAFQTNPVIPAKRQRTGNDALGASPRTAPGLIGSQRSQTPQGHPQAQNPYGSQNGSQGYQQPPNPFPHMQNTAPHQASASPAPSNASYNPQIAAPQRHPTSSPHQYSANGTPGYNNYGQSMNNPKSNMSGAAGTPQPIRGIQGYNQANTGNAQIGHYGNLQAQQGQMSQNPSAPGHDPQAALQMQQQQQQYRMKLQQAQQQLLNNNAASQNRPQVQNGPSGVASSQMPGTPMSNGMAIGQQANAPGQGTPSRPPLASQNTEQNFVARLTSYMQQKGQTLEQRPAICGRPVSYYNLFSAVNNARTLAQGSPTFNNWSLVAQSIGFPPAEYPSAGQELEALFRQNLLGFVTTWMSLMKNRMQIQQQQMTGRTNQSSPPAAAPSGPQASSPATTAFQPPFQSSTHPTPSQRKASLPPPQFPPSTFPTANDSSMLQNRPQNVASFQPPMARKSSMTDVKTEPKIPAALVAEYAKNAKPVNFDLSDPKELPRSPTYRPVERTVESWGGLPLPLVVSLSDDLHRVKPGMPTFDEMGIIDLHALTLSIQSGMHGEMRYALDHLLSLSTHTGLSLTDCEGLFDALIDCAEDQLDYLMRESTEESDEIQLPQFEELLVLAKAENESFVDRTAFSSTDYERMQAAERLLAVTGIIRNISFEDSAANHDLLAKPPLVAFLSSVVRLLGTRSMLLYSYRNAADFMKDAVTLLSMISHRIELPGKEEALSVLHLLISFAPAPPPTSSPDQLAFAFYEPSTHIYLPSAVDALAKLLARDEPNRSFYKPIYAADATNPPATQLLTRTFALAISPIPDRSKGCLVDRATESRISEARKPFFCQGMLAADILASLVPIPSDADGIDLASLWFNSEDGWAQSLVQLVTHLALDPNNTGIVRDRAGRQFVDEMRGFQLVTRKALSMLKRLASKLERSTGASPFKIEDETIVIALCSNHFDMETWKWLVQCASVGS
jgi:SWI/SNF chromatin-remodeling complex subunit SWI1